MKKRLLLLTAVLSASANFMFAQNNTSATVTDRNGNTYSYDTVRDLDASSEKGETVYFYVFHFPAAYFEVSGSDIYIDHSF